MTHKMFTYEPYSLRDGAVKDYMQSHMNTTRNRLRKLWVTHGCDDRKPHPSMSLEDWYECSRFWKSEKGREFSACMVLVRACEGRLPNRAKWHVVHRKL